ncbi:MAG TPA: tail fiber protein [Thermoanaerobaculia bacterium]|jgi:microcystin-dependent protein
MDPFVAEVRMFPYYFAPKAWAFCDGQLLPISQNTALFSLLGTVYGGDGKSTFALPNLRDSVPIHPAYDLSYPLGAMGGSETVTLLQSEIPVHTHTLRASVEDGTQGSLTNGITLASSVGGTLYQSNTSANLATMHPQALSVAGASFPHNNLQPYLTMNYCISLQGVFPQRP